MVWLPALSPLVVKLAVPPEPTFTTLLVNVLRLSVKVTWPVVTAVELEVTET